MSNFSDALGELKETNQVVEDTVEYCESLLTQFMHQDGIDSDITNEAKECVQNAMQHVVEHVQATGEQLNLALEEKERTSKKMVEKVNEMSQRISNLSSLKPNVHNNN